MILCHCQSDLFYFTYRFFGSCLECGNTLFMILFDNPYNSSLDFSRLFKKIATLNKRQMAIIDKKIKISLDLRLHNQKK